MVLFGVGFMPYVLVACEESQAVTMAFRRLGIEAYSCDIKPALVVILSGILLLMQGHFLFILVSL